MNRPHVPTRLVLVAVAAFVTASAGCRDGDRAAAPQPFALMVGDPAPRLEAARWAQGQPVASFSPGRVYVVDFWASWCGPCIASLPHLNSLAQRYANDATFVWMNVWEPRPLEVDALLSGLEEGPAFAVALDQVHVEPGQQVSAAMYDGRTAVGWLQASGKDLDGIPVAFLIDRRGRVAWIGNPADIDAPLAEVVASRWDLEQEASRYRLVMEKRARSAPLERRLGEAMKSRNWDAAIAIDESLLAIDPIRFADRATSKFSLLLHQKRQPAEAYAYARQLLGTMQDSAVLNNLAWTIVDPRREMPHRDLELARQAVDRAAELAGHDDASILVTRARVAFLSNDRDAAIRDQERALQLAGEEERKGMEETLTAYREAR
jgi:thiol-disulfide isomerase/thioredoxin